MNNIKLSLKIGLGFGVLLLIACGLGAMAILSMDNVSNNANELTKKYVPQVTFANQIERHVLLLMYAMRGFSMTGDAAFRQEALNQLDTVKKQLSQAEALSKSVPGQAAFQQHLQEVRTSLEAYDAKGQEIEKRIKEFQALRDKMDATADLFLTAATEYHGNQLGTLEKQISEGAPNYELRKQASKIKMIYMIVKEAQSIQTSSFKAQVLNDPELTKAGLENFFVVFNLLKNIKRKTKLPENIEALDKITKRSEEYEAAMKSGLATWEQLQQLVEEQKQRALHVLKGAETMATVGMDNMRAITEQNVAQLNSAKIFMAAGLAGALILGVLLSLVITRAITKPILAAVHFAEQIARGNLEDTLKIQQKDEIGNLADSLRKMVSNLKVRILEAHDKSAEAEKAASEAQQAVVKAEQAHTEALGKSQAMAEAANKLQTVAEITTSASEQLSAQVEQSSKGAGQQAQRMSETAAAMEEMSATVLEVAKNASTAAEISSEARQQAQQGADVVSEVIKHIGTVQTEATALKQDMTRLGEQAEGIGQILSVISDIADQTNLLALNAAIEAARAGEAGRGFAVVADEVRKLAEKTMSATQEVGQAIGSIQTGTRKNMANVDRTVSHIAEATSLARQSGEALHSIVMLVEQTSDQVGAIAAASQQQSSASEEINHSIEEVSTISSETADAMNQAARAVVELAGQSHELKRLIESMQTE